MVYVDYSGICYAIALVIGFLTAGLLMIYIQKRKYGDDYVGPGKNLQTKVLGAFIVVLIFSNCLFVGMIYVDTHQRRLEYDLEVHSSTSGHIIVPVSQYTTLESKLKLTLGDGDLEVIDTEHGRGIKVQFDGPVDVKGDLMTIWRIVDWDLSMPTFNGSHQWIYYEPSGEGDEPCLIELKLSRVSPIGSEAELVIEANLSPGWNPYLVEERFVEV